MILQQFVQPQRIKTHWFQAFLLKLTAVNQIRPIQMQIAIVSKARIILTGMTSGTFCKVSIYFLNFIWQD